MTGRKTSTSGKDTGTEDTMSNDVKILSMVEGVAEDRSLAPIRLNAQLTKRSSGEFESESTVGTVLEICRFRRG